MTLHITDAPQRLRDLWEWIVAIDSWIYGDGELLAELIMEEEIPDEFKGFISRIITGKEKQKRKRKIPARERMEIAQHLEFSLAMLAGFRTGITPDGKSFCNFVGEQNAQEPSEVMDMLNEMNREIISDAAEELEVSTETIENLLRDMRSYIKNWPLV